MILSDHQPLITQRRLTVDIQISDLAAVLIHRSGSSCKLPLVSNVRLRIHLDLPSFHYYYSVHEKLEAGLCTCEEAREWISAIEKRYDQLSKVFESAIRHELARRGESSSHAYEIEVTPRRNIVASSIREALEIGETPSFDRIFEKLNHLDDSVWHPFLRLLSPKDMPKDFRSLGYLFYVLEAIRPAVTRIPDQQVHGSKIDSQSRLLLFSIDDAAERRIYSRSQKLLKKIRQSPSMLVDPTLVEVYMSRRVFINRNAAGSNLYLDDPTPEKPTCGHSGVLEQNTENGLLDTADVIRQIYGSDCACIMQRLFAEVGL